VTGHRFDELAGPVEDLGPDTLPVGWIETTLGEVFRWGSGGTPLSSVAEYYDGDVPWAMIGDLNDGVVNQTQRTITQLGLKNSSAKLIEPGHVLVAMYGSIGKLGLAGVPMATNQAIAFTKPDPVNARFLFWYLRSIRNDLFHLGKGGTQRNISQAVLKDVRLPVAPLAEQRRIVAEIETQFTRLDAAVAALERARANLKRYRAAVLERTFDGPRVPVSTVLKSPLINGRSVRDKPGGFPVLRLTALKNGWLDLDQFKEGAWTKEQARPYVVSDNDFFVARGNGSLALVGRGGLARATMNLVAFPDTMIRIRCDSAKILPQFLRLVWDSPSMRKQIESVARTTAGIHKINQRDVESFLIPMPDLDVQERIVYEADACLTVANHIQGSLEVSLQRAERLRQAILRKAFAGQLVPQDPTDEPASLLLECIRAERARTAGKRPQLRRSNETQHALW
jgi:type I restriction enzyme, S subunit